MSDAIGLPRAPTLGPLGAWAERQRADRMSCSERSTLQQAVGRNRRRCEDLISGARRSAETEEQMLSPDEGLADVVSIDKYAPHLLGELVQFADLSNGGPGGPSGRPVSGRYRPTSRIRLSCGIKR